MFCAKGKQAVFFSHISTVRGLRSVFIRKKMKHNTKKDVSTVLPCLSESVCTIGRFNATELEKYFRKN